MRSVVGRVLAIDLGEVHMGLAVSDELMLTAQPLPTYRRKGWRQDLAHLRDLVARWEVGEVVVGLPKSMGGATGPQASHAQAFAEKVQKAFTIPVTLWDERLTTAQAERTLIQAGLRRARRRQVIDSVAALLILQNYLDRRGRERRE